MKNKLKIFILFVVIILSLIGCSYQTNKELETMNEVIPMDDFNNNMEELEEIGLEIQNSLIPTPEPTPIVTQVSFLAIGDVLLHKPVYNAAKVENTYDFTSIFKDWEEEIKSVDFACANQETIFVDEQDGYTSYPCFGSPMEIGLEEEKVGFDIITHATNHTYDRQTKGIEYTLDFWKEKKPLILGIHSSQEEYETIDIIEKNDITFSFLNFTYGLNGFQLPKDKPYLVDLIDENNEWLDKIEKANENSEVVVCFLHVGTEYINLPSSYAMEKVELAIDSGADIVVCAHPHVIEPYGFYTTQNGDEALVYWSLGNFVSNQQDFATNLGGVALFTVQKTIDIDGSEKIEIIDAKMEGTITHQVSNGYRSIPLNEYTNELAKEHKLYNKISNFSIERYNEHFNKIINDYESCNTICVEEKLPYEIK